ncbi:hypothetical protein HPP92_021396 [Vanilla planifolia]|uniref:SHSP domain-containing protein n=1 Tax=Vanilla planifolia TaxID=51239 RepID=A0A835Q1S9_VANPL|nr:hypothetical protein HPP92_021771 [Vanilla planifolia]KAG0462920.1 hypothetical protein HPP92_021396 [Vanilla planifolia]
MYSTATKRVRRILDHMSGSDDIPPQSSYLFSMACSTNLNSVQRSENRVLSSLSASVPEAACIQQDSTKEQNLPPKKCHSPTFKDPFYPLFSRDVRLDVSLSDLRNVHLLKKGCVPSSTEAYGFSGTNTAKISEQPVFCRTPQPTISDGFLWSPRIDVAESCSNYFVTVELPGANINGIRVEVDDKSLTVIGKRVMQWHGNTKHCSKHTKLIYHKKEILQGPYEVVWPLPKDVNKACISAEFVDGFLRIELPKV